LTEYEGPQILSNLRAASDAGPISRILYSVAAVTVIPLGRPLLDGSSDLPGSLARRAGTHRGFLFKGSATACACFALASGSSEPALAGRSPGHPGSFPIWSCSVWGLPCPVHCCAGGALLPHLFTLTPGFRPGRYVFCGTFRRTCFKAPQHAKRVLGTPRTRPPGRYPAHCSAEFGLSSLFPRGLELPSVRGKMATIRSSISYLHYRMVAAKRWIQQKSNAHFPAFRKPTGLLFPVWLV
jgi:hypothetical protein